MPREVVLRPWLAPAFVMLLAAPARAADLPELAERTKPAVVLLTVEDSSGRKLGTGTGFFVSPDGRIVTNQHVIEGGARVTATLSDGTKRAVLGVLASDEEKDVAILKVEGEGLPALPLGDSSRVKPGDEVVVIGSPMGLSGTLTVGIVSAIRERGLEDDEARRGDEGRSWGIQITAAISPGSSGSPIMTRSGEVIAVAVGAFNGAQSLNFGVPIEVASSLLRGLGPRPEVAPLGAASKHDVLQNLLISGGVFGALALLYLLWSRHEARGPRPGRPRRAA
jgi:S1-C subfamily serine protease